MAQKILLVEDEKILADLLEKKLKEEKIDKGGREPCNDPCDCDHLYYHKRGESHKKIGNSAHHEFISPGIENEFLQVPVKTHLAGAGHFQCKAM